MHNVMTMQSFMYVYNTIYHVYVLMMHYSGAASGLNDKQAEELAGALG